LTEIEIYQISESQERAPSKRFSYVCRPSRIARDRASAMRSATAKLKKLFQFYNRTLKIGILKIHQGIGVLSAAWKHLVGVWDLVCLLNNENSPRLRAVFML